MDKRKQPKPRFWSRKKGDGDLFKFILDHVAHGGDECVIWPYGRLPKGYGILSYNGRSWRAHRLMCILAHGEPPTRQHLAAHSCGNGHGGCINPKHLDWKTTSENNFDRRLHGTAVTSYAGGKGKLKPEQVQTIRSSVGITDAAQAQQIGVSEETVRKARVGLTFRTL